MTLPSDSDVIAAFVRDERLPASFIALAEQLHLPLADRIARAAEGRDRPLVVGLCGPQGAGKSTLTGLLTRLLEQRSLATANLSLDDLYLTRAQRMTLAATVHPLLRTRGVPGTHDVALGLAVLDALAMPGATLIPRFNKAADDRFPPTDGQRFAGPAAAILLEGWCVGAAPQPAQSLIAPVNALERDEDPDGAWRASVNAALSGPYRALFERIDLLIVLTAPDFATVRAWRGQQEARLRERLADPAQAMDEATLDRFVAHYQRLTEWIAIDLPPRADIAIRLDADRWPMRMQGL